ncbi:MAG TPA: LacI family DNA-binding transcriptional regulator [Actinomycetaceae bacterium]|nr:LacI family DNA-binding transcriptional regulator [Actinomycetaceae bacterium]
MTTPTRRSTAADVAAAAGVSRSTVSFVLNATPGQTISDAVRQRVRAEAARLGYRPHAHARALVSGASRTVLVPLPEWPVEYVLRQILDEAEATLDDAGYTLVTSGRHHSGNARPLWETLQPDIVLPIERLAAEEAAAIRELGIRVVEFDSDETEYVESVDAQVAHLVDRGHRVLAYASTTVPGMGRMSDARIARARRACADAGVRLQDAVVEESTARFVVREWRRAGVTGVASFNDDTAALILGAAIREGLRVPSELAVIGHDDSPIARLLVPSLSSIRFDTTGLGRHLAALALAAAAGGPPPTAQRPPTHARVVHREST